MRKSVPVLFLFLLLSATLYSYPRLSLVERFTNAGCVPCADINNAWYNALTAQMLQNGEMIHLVYNVDWPSPSDPMFLLNSNDNNIRRGLYGVNAVPWIQVNGTNITTSSAALQSAVTSGNTQYSPFKIEIIAERFSNNVVSVSVKITRDSTDVSSFGVTKLFVSIMEKDVNFTSPPGPNGESSFHAISRKMLPNAKGTVITIPEPGASITSELMYIPTSQFLSSVILENLRVVAFIQNTDTKLVYQSAMSEITSSARLHAAFTVEEDLGAIPFNVTFVDYSTQGASPITSWEWDFDNNGTIDATGQSVQHSYTEIGPKTVRLVVSDGVNSHTRILENIVNSIEKNADILVVNGVERVTYPTEMANMYLNSAVFGEHDVDVWDLFGSQGFDYSLNTQVKSIHYFNRTIPTSVLKLYPRVIWIGNNFGGDISFYSAAQVLDYVQSGGNFLLATRQGLDFFNSDLMNYTGVQSFSGLVDFTTPLLSLDQNLQDMPVLPTNTRNQIVLVDTTAGAVRMFTNTAGSAWTAGFRIKKQDAGTFIYIAGRPYRFNNDISGLNYDYIINNYMPLPEPTDVSDNELIPAEFSVSQNYPNPFNPATSVAVNLPAEGYVTAEVFNTLGQKVATLFEGDQPAGRMTLNWNANVSSGIYLLKVQVNSALGISASTVKMTLMK